MQRTIRVQLQPSPAQVAALSETSRQFTAAFNLFVDLGWRAGVANATKLLAQGKKPAEGASDSDTTHNYALKEFIENIGKIIHGGFDPLYMFVAFLLFASLCVFGQQ